MNQELENLIALQSIDTKILEIQELAGDLPEKVKRNKEIIFSTDKELSDINQKLESIDSENRKVKADTEDGQVTLNRYKDQLFLVKSNKEYDALNKEIDHLKSALTESEEKYIGLEEEKEKLLELKKDKESSVEQLKETLEKEKNLLNASLSDSQLELEQLTEKRLKVVASVGDQHLDQYNVLTKGKELGVAALTGNCCGSCYSTLPPQMVVEIKSNNFIHTCPSCGVYAYWEKE